MEQTDTPCEGSAEVSFTKGPRFNSELLTEEIEDEVHLVSYGSSAPARLRVGHSAVLACNADEMLPTHQASTELASSAYRRMTDLLSGCLPPVCRHTISLAFRIQHCHDEEGHGLLCENESIAHRTTTPDSNDQRIVCLFEYFFATFDQWWMKE
ncbi:uncharacterized protein LOC127748888 isoform X2 [Frankliniella occidentalis]|uniref:Uncharacterized protein LOC127748888 isoform X2 n=1 Tax=Frankliniella occidentalis TaxID=133901 RepID=A0A9C6WW13_FRAOC|nr:uncharacterized protein LOC127748888 isoform X2 [Frankliniella occidentalis]